MANRDELVAANEVIAAAERVKEYCRNRSDCYGCIFDGTNICPDGSDEATVPSAWDIPNPRRFTNEDIALAKALKAFGAIAIGMDESNHPYMIDGDSYMKLPYTAFMSLEINEEIGIDTIIAEDKK